MVAFTYNVFDPLTSVFVGQLDVKAPSWIEAVNTNGTFTGSVVVPGDPELLSSLRDMTEPGRMLYVGTDRGLIPWSGYITKRGWDPASNTLAITAIEWRAYLDRVFIAPQEDLLTDNVYIYDQQEQLFIARDLVAKVIADGAGQGVPNIQQEFAYSGVLRDLLVNGTKFRTLASWIDSMASRDGGFEWDVYVKLVSNVPQLCFRTWFPQRGGSVAGLEFFYGSDGNILTYDPPDETNDQRVTRQWAIGSGPDSASLPFALDDDPGLANNTVLRLDSATSYQDIGDPTILASHARAERQFYEQTLTLFTFTTTLENPYVYDYGRGDRCRLHIKDRWIDIDVDSVRILQREVQPEVGGGIVKVTVDLSDLTLPDVDTGA